MSFIYIQINFWYPYRDANNTIVVFYDVDVAKTHALNMDKQNNE